MALLCILTTIFSHGPARKDSFLQALVCMIHLIIPVPQVCIAQVKRLVYRHFDHHILSPSPFKSRSPLANVPSFPFATSICLLGRNENCPALPFKQRRCLSTFHIMVILDTWMFTSTALLHSSSGCLLPMMGFELGVNLGGSSCAALNQVGCSCSSSSVVSHIDHTPAISDVGIWST